MDRTDTEIQKTPALPGKEWINRNLFSILEELAQCYPNKTAVTDEIYTLSYSELYTKSVQIAGFISNKAKGNHSPIALWLDNDSLFIAAMFACIANGIPYVPLDATFPQQRNTGILTHAEVQFIITDTEIKKVIEQPDLPPFFTLEDSEKHQTMLSDTYTSGGESLCYILYTSGSTGKPKGVYQNQRNLLHDVWQYIYTIQLTHNDRSTLLYSPAVSGAIRDIFGTLLTGATLFIRDLKKQGIQGLADFLTKHKITIYHSVPTVFRTFLQVSKAGCFDTVRLVYLAGDRIFKSDYELYKQHFPENARLYIGIGSTENATIYRQWLLDHHQEIETELMPVGFAVADRDMKIVDEHGNEVADTITGEIQVTSNYMALGYWNDEALTHRHFKSLANGCRVYNTGDLGRINNNGLLEFAGRKDKQIKINGHRVEPDEIIALMQNISGVKKAAIVLRKEQNTVKISAYLQTKENVNTVKNSLSKMLPPYMLPSFFYAVEELPLLPNFKIDLHELEKLDIQNLQNEKAEISSLEKIEDKFSALWKKYTSAESYERNEPWGRSTATSIDAIHFLVELEKLFHIDFQSGYFTPEMTPASVLAKIRSVGTRPETTTGSGNKPIVYIFPWLCGIRQGHQQLITFIARYMEVRIVTYPDYKHWSKKQQLFDHFCNVLQESIVFEKNRPLFFLGILSGSYFAHELCYRLSKQSEYNLCGYRSC